MDLATPWFFRVFQKLVNVGKVNTATISRAHTKKNLQTGNLRGTSRCRRAWGWCFRERGVINGAQARPTTTRSPVCWTLRNQDLLHTGIAEPLKNCGTGIIFSPSLHQPRHCLWRGGVVEFDEEETRGEGPRFPEQSIAIVYKKTFIKP